MVCSIRYLWFVLMPLLFQACATMRDCPIETLQPAKMTFEGSKRDIAICIPQNLFSEALRSNPDTRGVRTDSLMKNILYSLQKSWKEVPGYEETQFYLFILRTNELPGADGFDLVVWLNRLQIKNFTSTQYGSDDENVYRAGVSLHVQYSANWSARDPSGIFFDEYVSLDLMSWQSHVQLRENRVVTGLPSVRDAWWDMGIAVANDYAARNVPQWQTGIRNIYMINRFPELSQLAYTAIQRNAYGRAFDIWENMLLSCRKRRHKNTKSQIAYNMAIVCEFRNELEQAVYWAERSTTFWKKAETVKYLELLKERQKHRVKLDQQMNNGIFE